MHPNSIDLGLERISQVAQKLGLQVFTTPVITLAGTNGKGSSAAMLAAIYTAAGYRTAVYTSPHLLLFTERLHIQNQPLPESRWCAAFAHIDKGRANVSLTYFEFVTLAALLLIQQHALDVIILEVGMGGRLDAVNIVPADLAIITSIALDHVEYLGSDREAIGYEKAGIFRSRTPAVCGDPNVPKSVIAAARKLASPLFCQQRDFFYTQLNEQLWRWHNHHTCLAPLPVPALPLQNAATILQAIDLLQAQLPVSVAAITGGLAKACLKGRMQRLAAPMHTILDVTHNPHAAHLLASNLAAIQPQPAHWHAVVGMLKDKDISGTLAPLGPLISHWYLASLTGERGATALLLQQALASLGIISTTQSFETPALAYQQAVAKALENDAIIVFGSFYTVADVLIFTQ